MSEKQKHTPDPFPHLGRRPLFVTVETPGEVKPIVRGEPVTVYEEAADVPDSVWGGVVSPSPQVTDAMSAIDRVEAEKKAKRGRGRGRPKSEGVKPWEAEGVSRASWYRRKTEGK